MSVRAEDSQTVINAQLLEFGACKEEEEEEIAVEA